MLFSRYFFRPIHLLNIILLCGTLLTTINLLHLRTILNETRNLNTPDYFSKDFNNEAQPIAWITGHKGFRHYLSHVIEIFGNLGYKLYLGRPPENISFDVLWSHQYPFSDPLFSSYLIRLQPHQKVNHIPGSGYYTSKVSLSTAGLKFGVPKAFDLSAKRDEFINYANAHPDKFWVKKNNEHRGIKIRNIKELDLSDNNSFIQEYISQPLLIDNRKFDIGIYTVITSVFPLRVYIYGGDALLRFCSKDYEPFDANDIDKYVVADNYTPLWEMPSLKKYYVEQQMTFQHAFNAYISELGKDPDIIWDRIKEIIAAVFESQQNKMIAAGANFVDKRPFFELSRFDFVLDKDLNVYLMEANLSPNLSSGHFLPNKLLYKQVIINVLSLVGIASHLHGISPKDRLKIYKNKPYFSEDGDNQEMLVSDRDIQVFNNDCFSNSSKCSGKDGCKKELKCQLCRHCMNYQLRDILRSAYEEHMSRRIMRRILPRTVHKTRRFDILRSELDRLLTLWFDDKCKDDKTWCF